jgi:hypothetical protein
MRGEGSTVPRGEEKRKQYGTEGERRGECSTTKYDNHTT